MVPHIVKSIGLENYGNILFIVFLDFGINLYAPKELVALKVKKDTPLFTVYNPVNIPNEKSAPKKALIVVVYLFLEFVLSVGFVFGKKAWVGFKKEWASK